MTIHLLRQAVIYVMRIRVRQIRTHKAQIALSVILTQEGRGSEQSMTTRRLRHHVALRFRHHVAPAMRAYVRQIRIRKTQIAVSVILTQEGRGLEQLLTIHLLPQPVIPVMRIHVL